MASEQTRKRKASADMEPATTAVDENSTEPIRFLTRRNKFFEFTNFHQHLSLPLKLSLVEGGPVLDWTSVEAFFQVRENIFALLLFFRS